MNAQTDFDIGPLTWVKSEIDLALERADKALQELAASVAFDNANLGQVRFCRTHLHQVQGALTIVGLDGVTQFTEALEALLEAVERQEQPCNAAHIELGRRAMASLRHYLDDLIGGQPNQALRLLPVYRELQTARGQERVLATDLFFPDLRVRPPRRNGGSPKISGGEFHGRLRQQRAYFQRGLLSWLRAPQSGAGVPEMLNAVKRIDALQELPSARAFWWVATAFLTALAERALPADADARQLCTRIDLQIRRLLEGSSNVAERLMRDALYLVGNADSKQRAVHRVQAAYQLAALLPGAAPETAVAEESVRRRLREAIASTEESWNKFCAGSTQALPTFRSNATALAAVVEELGQADFCRLVQAIGEVAEFLLKAPIKHSEALAMETATAILLALNAQGNIQYLDSSFTHQVNVMVDRIHGCLSGKPLSPESELPSLDEMSRQAQEKLLISQVAREIQNNLTHIEQVLDGFFRDVDKGADLESLETPLRQVIGALTMMRHEAAVAVLKKCAADIKAFSAADYVPLETDFEQLAEKLSLLGFFVDALQHGATDFDAFVRKMESSTGREVLVEEPAATVEKELEQQKLDAHALLQALKGQPDDAQLRQQVVKHLAALQKDSDLVGDKDGGPQIKQLLSVLAAAGDASAQLDATMAALKPQTAETPLPSAETIQLSQATSEEVDAEILEIFLAEAEEVLAGIDHNFQLLKTQPQETALLTAIRRAVHTLKGSGRMVGLRDFGEAAWSVEQVLNLWLRQEHEVTPAIVDLLGQAYSVFVIWVAHLKTGHVQAPDATGMMALAASLLRTSEDSSVVETPLPEAAAKPDDRAGDERSLRQRLTITSALAEIFNEEAGAHLATLQHEFAVLESDLLAPTTHEMYRAAHTLAGIAGTVGIEPVNQLSMALEHAVSRRNQAANPDSVEALETIRQAIAGLALMLTDIAGFHEPEAAPVLIDALASLYLELSVEKRAALAEEEGDAGRGDSEVGETSDAALDAEELAVHELVSATAAPPLAPITATQPSAAALGGSGLVAPEMQDELDEQLLPLFLEEALDLTQSIATQLRAWRSKPSDSDVLRRLARLFHTLKGSARMAGAMNLGELTHAIETRMAEAQQAENSPLELIDDIDNAFDVIVQIVERLQRGELGDAPVDVSDEAAGKIASDAEFTRTAAGHDVPAEAPEQQQEGESDTGEQRALLRVRADLIDRLVNEAGELSIARSRIEGEMRAIKGSLLDLTENVIRLRRQLRDIELQAELQMQSRTALADERRPIDFDPLEFDRFTRFQELTRMMAESVNDVATVQQNLLKNLDDANAAILAQSRLNRELQQELMSVRMVPFSSIADRLYRIVRQAGKELGKRANLEISGGQLQLDRTVLDKMLAPLEHMLRNAIAHGLENTPQRLAKGKPEIGELSLKLTQEGNEVIVAFADDGAGLDLQRLRERGLAAGLLNEEQAADEAQIVEMIFAPGISTASGISRLAGRGIGMDVLKSAVVSLGGRIEVLSTPDQGTTFRLYLPLTLAVTKALLVRSGQREYAIPAAMIEQVLDLKEKGLTRIREANAALWSGNPYPFHYLPHLLGEPQALPERHSQYWVLLLRSGTRRVALQVDEVLGNQEVVVKNIGPQLARVIGVSGATVLGNGQVLLILNPVALASRPRTAIPVSPLPTLRQAATTGSVAATLPTVMIVDDSLTVRKISSRLLAREGYQVMTAKDGLDALEQLVAIIPDVLLVDIEMPRMDGFELTRNLRADERLRGVPIVMITSRTAEKHRHYAFELGVNHYLGKPYQEEELLRLVAAHVKAQRGP
ncbi:MAG: response regulator [Candidatus Accumulibacter meliphilus]|jgi:chemosensory pili system protein ChpA (sensor histidine kinase/response regulator)|uniref:Chemotaxis protein CheA n=1 Tax=Candidatus Accumulibacter meliphilus TaxID=2211374 RepID=A0A369XMV9_9PROT|nr:MAG: response regulator [Candidatus Accumulibacter meliphilus]